MPPAATQLTESSFVLEQDNDFSTERESRHSPFALPPRVLIRCASTGYPAFMPITCPDCAASMPENVAFCPACGQAMHEVERARGKVGILPEPVAGALAYCTFFPALIFLWLEPYRTNRFVRFHSFQCIGLFLVAIAAGAVLRIVGVLLALVPSFGPLLVLLASMLIGLGLFVIWLVLVVKALQGEMFKLPFVGNYAEKQAGAS